MVATKEQGNYGGGEGKKEKLRFQPELSVNLERERGLFMPSKRVIVAVSTKVGDGANRSLPFAFYHQNTVNFLTAGHFCDWTQPVKADNLPPSVKRQTPQRRQCLRLA